MMTKKIGIIGGGQLAFFLSEAAKKLGLSPIVLSESLDVPAKRSATQLLQGSFQDPKIFRTFFSEVKTVIFENEWINTDLLEQESRGEVSFFPSLNVMQRLQDKLSQKEELVRLGIPTPPFIVIDPTTDLQNKIDEVCKKFGKAFVLKWSRNGYDGKGILIVDSDKKSFSEITNFCNRAFENESIVYAEPMISFDQELALVAVRSTQGEFIHYPLVVSVQREGTCQSVFGTAENFGIPIELQNEAISNAKKLADELNLVGSFAIEFFMTSEKKLLVNEIAPRVHNSGHYTLEASVCSQFANHLKSILGMKLSSPKTKPYFAMLNLLGPDKISIDQLENYQPKKAWNIFVHWYGKKSLRPKRKMGHITAFAENENESKKMIENLQRFEAEWINEMKQMATSSSKI